jgi:hypothetical protein
MARKYVTRYGDVIVRKTVSDIGIVYYSGVMVREGEEVIRRDMSSVLGTEEEERTKRRMLVECIVSCFEKSKLITPEEKAVVVIDIVKKHLFQGVARG